jgi:hypothetical protein
VGLSRTTQWIVVEHAAETSANIGSAIFKVVSRFMIRMS